MKQFFAVLSLGGAMICTTLWVTMEGVQVLLVFGSAALTSIAVFLIISIRSSED